jgi:hypothetical protein
MSLAVDYRILNQGILIKLGRVLRDRSVRVLDCAVCYGMERRCQHIFKVNFALH